MKVMKFTDPGVKEARRHPALRDLPLLGRGTFCAVFDNGDTVLKLTADGMQYSYYTDGYAPTGDHFPTVLKNHGEIGKSHGTQTYGMPLYLVETEKLQPINQDCAADTRRLARRLIEELDAIWYSRDVIYAVGPSGSRSREQYDRDRSIYALTKIQQEQWLSNQMKEALEDVSNFVANFECGIDFHMKNVMRRGECLVLNDVVADIATLTTLR